ncbi:hypothetical protein NBRGN_088_00030 [Nocardia brasiliensis NBRC 14402]|nr:hypothetical protein NBRGN_088_00030 [Nocardia brasiliensis NBRC 14402]
MTEYAHEHDGNWLVEVQNIACLLHNLFRIVEIGFHECGDALVGGVDQQGPRMRQHERIVVHVNDLGLGRDTLRDLVRVLHRRQSGADVEELPDARLGGEMTHHADQESARLPGHRADIREYRFAGLAGNAVDFVKVLSPEPIIPDPCGVRYIGADQPIVFADHDAAPSRVRRRAADCTSAHERVSADSEINIKESEWTRVAERTGIVCARAPSARHSTAAQPSAGAVARNTPPSRLCTT